MSDLRRRCPRTWEPGHGRLCHSRPVDPSQPNARVWRPIHILLVVRAGPTFATSQSPSGWLKALTEHAHRPCSELVSQTTRLLKARRRTRLHAIHLVARVPTKSFRHCSRRRGTMADASPANHRHRLVSHAAFGARVPREKRVLERVCHRLHRARVPGELRVEGLGVAVHRLQRAPLENVARVVFTLLVSQASGRARHRRRNVTGHVVDLARCPSRARVEHVRPCRRRLVVTRHEMPFSPFMSSTCELSQSEIGPYFAPPRLVLAPLHPRRPRHGILVTVESRRHAGVILRLIGRAERGR